MRNSHKAPSVALSDEVVVVDGGGGSVPLTNGERADGRSVTIKSEPYPSSQIEDVNRVEVIDVAQSGVGVTFEYDKQRKSLYIILGNNEQIGKIKRKKRITKDRILTNWKWARRVIFGSWDRDLEKWIEEDENREARASLAGAPGQLGGPHRNEEHKLGVDIEAGRKIDYLNVWRIRVHKYSRMLEFICLGIPIVLAYLDLHLLIGIPLSLALFGAAWWLDGVKSKNRRWKARLGK